MLDLRTANPGLAATLAIVVMAGSLAAPADAQAADDTAFIAYRQKVMSAIGANMGAISDILKNGLPFTDNIEQHAENLEGNSKLIASAFEKRIVDGATDAEPAIWKDWSKFEQAIRDFEQAAEALEMAADKGDMAQVGAKVKALGKSCGGCHKSFRKPKEESYKRK